MKHRLAGQIPRPPPATARYRHRRKRRTARQARDAPSLNRQERREPSQKPAVRGPDGRPFDSTSLTYSWTTSLPCSTPGVGHRNRNSEVAARTGHCHFRPLECRIRQAVAERETRLDPGGVVESIPDEQALSVLDLSLSRGEVFFRREDH